MWHDPTKSPDNTDHFRLELPSIRSHEDLATPLLPIEARDIEILRTFAAPHLLYLPKAPVAMVVGASTVREGTIIREFYRQLGVSQPISVVGCNIRSLPPSRLMMEQYDEFLEGQSMGNAATTIPWRAGLSALERPMDAAWDFAYIRNPDLYDHVMWYQILNIAVASVGTDGLVAVLVRHSDVCSLEKIAAQLEREGEIPLFFQPTEMDLQDDVLSQHHTLLLLRGTNTYREALPPAAKHS